MPLLNHKSYGVHSLCGQGCTAVLSEKYGRAGTRQEYSDYEAGLAEYRGDILRLLHWNFVRARYAVFQVELTATQKYRI